MRTGEWVLVSCKVFDSESPSGSSELYDYRIESSPWNRPEYAITSDFWNGVYPDQNLASPDADPSVPDCPQAPAAIAVGAHGTILSTVDSVHWTLRHSGVRENLYESRTHLPLLPSPLPSLAFGFPLPLRLSGLRSEPTARSSIQKMAKGGRVIRAQPGTIFSQ